METSGALATQCTVVSRAACSPKDKKGEKEKTISVEDSYESDAMSEEGARTHIWRMGAGLGAPGSVGWLPGV